MGFIKGCGGHSLISGWRMSGYNCKEICKRMKEAAKGWCKDHCFSGALPDRVYLQRSFYTGYTVKRGAQSTCKSCRRDTGIQKHLYLLELPLAVDGELYNVAAALNDGKILGFTTKTFLPNYGEFYEMRQFRQGPKKAREILL